MIKWIWREIVGEKEKTLWRNKRKGEKKEKKRTILGGRVKEENEGGWPWDEKGALAGTHSRRISTQEEVVSGCWWESTVIPDGCGALLRGKSSSFFVIKININPLSLSQVQRLKSATKKLKKLIKKIKRINEIQIYHLYFTKVKV